MAPLLDNHAKGVDELLTNSRKRPTEAHKLKHAIQTHADLVHGTMFPETDEDVIISIIMRFLNDSIFQKILYGSCASFVESLSFIEMALQNTVEPKRGERCTDLITIRVADQVARSIRHSDMDRGGLQCHRELSRVQRRAREEDA